MAEGRRGNPRKAIELFEEAIDVRPSDAGVYQVEAKGGLGNEWVGWVVNGVYQVGE